MMVPYYAWFLRDFEPRSKPNGGQAQPDILAGTKVSVKEEYMKDGKLWCNIWAPPGYVYPSDHYPELWVAADALSSEPIVFPGDPDHDDPADVELEEAVNACRVILRYLRGS